MSALKLKPHWACIVVILCFGTACQECVDIDVPYTEEEPYQAIEQNQVKLTYNVRDGGWKRIAGTILFDEKPRIEAFLELTNTGEKGGEFEVVQMFKNTLGEDISLRDKRFVNSGSTARFKFNHQLDHYVNVKSDGYRVVPPTVKVDVMVTKYREITKYRRCNTCVDGCGG